MVEFMEILKQVVFPLDWVDSKIWMPDFQKIFSNERFSAFQQLNLQFISL